MKITVKLILALALGLFAFGCSQSQGESPSAGKPTAKEPAGAEVPAAARADVDAALARYEEIRALLVDDKLAQTKEPAAKLATAAEKASKKGGASLKAHLDALAKAARAFEEQVAKEASPDEVRKAYGEVSRAVVALIHAAPSLRQGRHLFQCPMAQGYDKWVQTSPELKNPYMGTRMPKCGSKASWES